MNIRRQLKPKVVVDLIAQRTRKRIAALEDVMVAEYHIALP
jgi:hypothetical protein